MVGFGLKWTMCFLGGGSMLCFVFVVGVSFVIISIQTPLAVCSTWRVRGFRLHGFEYSRWLSTTYYFECSALSYCVLDVCFCEKDASDFLCFGHCGFNILEAQWT